HFGVLFVAIGHVGGVLVAASWVAALAIGDDLYPVLAVAVGAIAGFGRLAGAAILTYRRRAVGPVVSATPGTDTLRHLVLTAKISTMFWRSRSAPAPGSAR